MMLRNQQAVPLPTWPAVSRYGCVLASLLALALYRVLPRADRAAHFSVQALRSVWRFAAGSTTITILALLLTQVDKILLSHLLTLKAFGYYALAAAVAKSKVPLPTEGSGKLIIRSVSAKRRPRRKKEG